MIQEVAISGLSPLAFTDYLKIYITKDVDNNEKRVLRKHEKAHIYLQHRKRRKNYEEKFGKVDAKVWNIADDIEIALHIYDDHDVKIINMPRSPLNGGITKTNLPERLPTDCKYAEQIYEWLLENPQPRLVSFDGDTNDFESVHIETSDELIDVESLIKNAASQIIGDEIKENERIKTQQNHKQVKEKLKQKKQSLSSVIARKIKNNYAISKKKSYRRPERRENKDFIKKGVVITRTVPKITIYCDRSGSFNESKTSQATQGLKEITAKYRADVAIDTLYFNNDVLDVDPVHGNGGTNYSAVRDNIELNNPEIAIVITDNDYCCELEPVKSDIIVIPVGCQTTNFAVMLGAVEVAI